MSNTPKSVLSLSDARSAFIASGYAGRYREHYGQDAFLQWLAVSAPTLLGDTCDALDRDKQRLTLRQLSGLIRVQLLAKAVDYRNLTGSAESFGIASRAALAARICRDLDGSGRVLQVGRQFRQRCPSIGGIHTDAFWLTRVAHKPKAG